MNNPAEFPSDIEIEGLTSTPWQAKEVIGGSQYRVEAVAKGRGMLDGAPIVFYSALPRPDCIEAMTINEFRRTMEPSRNGK
ncbi:hypothetical protein [Vreelandella alkaliphila]|uniref:Uncharacterized protein n=1 Tax=Vreelandella alkaliphila TaxID=272774 RepID=A0AAJ2S0M7_9GAMM|nr:hypothetical protein [Halomonas alkaliphila]MDX5979571.1 hypothetical protein [Halomonas alkaliphila]